ncbi:MAG TPA: inositol monophosphatase family protein [Acidimicrobiales bacterium]|jgi:myo-inositol-1(or 4)-monophosphatase|nr:inositol monophosphatase family protein [Acidimicrobiales bacterium]
MPVPAQLDPLALLDVAVPVAEKAADLLRAGVRLTRQSVGTKSSATDMVTEMDRASEDLIVSALLGARPDDGIVAEEGSARTGTSGVRWVIDPLDGTTNYLYDFPGWSVSIAAELDGDQGGEVIAGVVLDAVHGELYTAARGHGAYCNGEPIACSDQADVADALLATGFGYDPARRRTQAQLLVELLPRVRDIRRMGSAAMDLCHVARGRVDAYFERGLSWWDLAAGALIAREAGAVVSALDGGPVVPGSVFAATPGIAAPLRALLGALGANDGA